MFYLFFLYSLVVRKGLWGGRLGGEERRNSQLYSQESLVELRGLELQSCVALWGKGWACNSTPLQLSPATLQDFLGSRVASCSAQARPLGRIMIVICLCVFYLFFFSCQKGPVGEAWGERRGASLPLGPSCTQKAPPRNSATLLRGGFCRVAGTRVAQLRLPLGSSCTQKAPRNSATLLRGGFVELRGLGLHSCACLWGHFKPFQGLVLCPPLGPGAILGQKRTLTSATLQL